MPVVPYWRLSGFYLFYFAAIGAFIPYWGLYLKAQGFTAEQIGELVAILVGTKIIAPNLWGWISDHTGKGLVVIRIASLFAAIAFAGIFFRTGYWWIAFVTLVFSFFWNGALPQFEAVTLTHLKEDTHRYSRIRIWGSVGFILTALAVGRAMDYFEVSLLPVLIVALLIGIWLTSLSVPESTNVEQYGERKDGLIETLKSPVIIAFLVVCMLIQVSHGPYYVFYSIYLHENGYSGSEIGQLWALGVLAEVVLFLFVYRLLKRYTLRQMLLISICLGMFRWILIAVGVNHLWVMVTAQLLHAASFGSAHVASIHLIHDYFDNHLRGRGQALYSSASFGLGGVVGSLFSGELWESLGPAKIYMTAALVSGFAFLIAWRWVGREATD